MDYPCECDEMKWMVDNNKVFKYKDNGWMLTWIELDKSKKGVNIEKFGVRINYCMFCGNKAIS